MGRSSRNYPPELRQRAVGMVREVRADYDSEWAAMQAVAKKLGIGSAETLRKWSRTTRRHWSSSRRSPGTLTPIRPASCTSRRVSSASSCSLAKCEMRTSAPSRAKASATARPIPESPPVDDRFLTREPAAAPICTLSVIGAGIQFPGDPRIGHGSIATTRAGILIHGISLRELVTTGRHTASSTSVLGAQ